MLFDYLPKSQRAWLFSHVVYLPSYFFTLQGQAILSLMIENFRTYIAENEGDNDG